MEKELNYPVQERVFPENRFFRVTYYKKRDMDKKKRKFVFDKEDPQFMKVKDIRTPSGDRGRYQISYKLKYFVGEFKKKGGYTEVYDIYGNKTTYHYTPFLRLKKIERYKKVQEDQVLVNSEKFIWGEEGTDKVTFLLGKGFFDSKNNPIFFREYFYDERGNIIRERFHGNLSGKEENFSLILDEKGFPKPNFSEVFEIRRTFSNDNTNRLLSEEDDSGIKTTYKYLGKSDLLISELTFFKNKMVRRNFYEYDEDNILRLEMEDNGTSKNKNDLTNVTVRKIKRITPKRQAPFIGMPEIIEEKYLDLNTKEEKLLKKVVLRCFQGLICKEDIYDENDNFRYSISKEYDHKSRLIREINPLGVEKNIKYDANNNQIYFKNFGSRLEKNIQHDLSNRMTEVREVGDDNITHVTQLKYDLKSNVIESKNFQENSIKNKYDAFGNVLETIFPKVNFRGTLKNPKVSMVYDDLNRKIKEIDQSGNILQIFYNAYNKPIKKIYPNGSEERFIYNLDGTLNTYIDQDNTRIKYEYDFLKREVNRKIISYNGKLLLEESKVFDLFNLLSFKDSGGNVTSYSYDFAGRKIEERFNGELGKKYFYDSLGRVQKIKIFCGGNSHYISYERDNLDRVISEKKEDCFGTVLFFEKYEYDNQGNKSSVLKYVDGKKSKTKFLYDSFNRLIRITNPLNFKTIFKYDENFVNSSGQKTLRKIEIDPLGLHTVTFFDVLNRVVSKEKRSNENVLAKENLFYDLADNLIKHVSTVIEKNEAKNVITTLYEYDCMNNVVSLTEAAGTEDEKRTFYAYTNKGLIHQITKPSGIVLKNSYDELNRKISMKSSDFSLDYFYEYNNLGLLVKVEDLVNGSSTTLIRDERGRVVREVLANGLFIEKKYDQLDRKTSLVLPDNSSIEYCYKPINLFKVIRKDSSGFELYFHLFSEYDLSNNLKNQQMVKNLGEISQSFDPLNRLKKISSPYLFQEIENFDEVGNIKTLKSNNRKVKYSYDELYQLVKEEGFFHSNFEYDSIFNRVSKNGEKYSVNDLNQITDVDEISFSYDRNGNLISESLDGVEREYRYDALDRLVEVLTERERFVFEYDGFNRRVSKRVDCFESGEFVEKYTHFYLYDDRNEIGIYEGDRVPVCLRVLKESEKAEIGAALALEVGGKVYGVVNDIFGNIAALIAESGRVEESYEYSVFGEEVIFGEEGDIIEKSRVNNPWRYRSKHTDETGLVYFGERYYDSRIGRWISCDPKGLEENVNLYLFLLNNPLIYVDLYGLDVRDRESPKSSRGILDYTEKYFSRIFMPVFSWKLPDFCDCYAFVLDHLFLRQDPNIHEFGIRPLKSKMIVFINGINTRNYEAKFHAGLLSKAGSGAKIDYVYNPRHGLLFDIQECMVGRIGKETQPVRSLDSLLTRHLTENPENTCLQIAHSQGAIHVKNALLRMPEELRERITVVTIAPAAIITDNLCRESYNYLSKWDPLPFLCDKKVRDSVFNRSSNVSANIIWLDRAKGAPWWDHSFQSPTYLPKLKEHVDNYLKN
jgi:RHS repeat-associated protein